MLCSWKFVICNCHAFFCKKKRARFARFWKCHESVSLVATLFVLITSRKVPRKKESVSLDIKLFEKATFGGWKFAVWNCQVYRVCAGAHQDGHLCLSVPVRYAHYKGSRESTPSLRSAPCRAPRELFVARQGTRLRAKKYRWPQIQKCIKGSTEYRSAQWDFVPPKNTKYNCIGAKYKNVT